MSNIPTWTIEAAWNANAIGGLLVIGASTIGGTDTIGGSFAYGTNFTALTEVQRVTITRGRADDLSQVQAGRCVLTLFDATGKYNPLNPSSALNGLLNPMRPLRVKGTDPADQSVHTLFFGFVQTITYNADPAVKQAIIEAIDLFEWLNNSYPTVAALTNQDCGSVIRQILYAIGWTQTALISLDASGKIIPSFSADGTKTALNYISDLLKVDQGLFYIAADGTATYTSRATLAKSQSAVTTLTQAQAPSMQPSVQVRLTVNSQTVTRTGGTAQTATDQTSQQAYGTRVGAGISSAYLATDGQADSLSRWIVTTQKDPAVAARPVKVSNLVDSGATLTQQLARELLDYVSVTDSAFGTTVTGRVNQIQHDISDGGKLLLTQYLVSKQAVTAFTLGLSTVGGADLIGY